MNVKNKNKIAGPDHELLIQVASTASG